MEEELVLRIEELSFKISYDIRFILPESVCIFDRIRSGGESTVFNGSFFVCPDLTVPCAIKQYNCDVDESLDYIMCETEFLVSLYKDPGFSSFFVKFFGLSIINGKYSLIIEKGETDLLSYKEKQGISREQVFKLAIKLLRILHYLHCNGIVHHDLKPENILIRHIIKGFDGETSDLDICLIDFSMTKRLPPKRKRIWTTDCNGTQGFQPPELIKKGTTYDQLIDIFACGISLCVLLMPTNDIKNVMDVLKQVHNDVLEEKLGKNLFTKFKIKMLNTKISKLLIAMISEKEIRKTVDLLNACETFNKGLDDIIYSQPPTPPSDDIEITPRITRSKSNSESSNELTRSSRVLRSGKIC